MDKENITYTLVFEEQAKKEIKALKKSETASYNKLKKLLEELQEHPRTGTGQVEALKYDFSGYYSRRVSKKHRLIYKIDDQKIIVSITSITEHYKKK